MPDLSGGKTHIPRSCRAEYEGEKSNIGKTVARILKERQAGPGRNIDGTMAMCARRLLTEQDIEKSRALSAGLSRRAVGDRPWNHTSIAA
jgi:hypothetical protein